jgi:hypothetical protein
MPLSEYPNSRRMELVCSRSRVHTSIQCHFDVHHQHHDKLCVQSTDPRGGLTRASRASDERPRFPWHEPGRRSELALGAGGRTWAFHAKRVPVRGLRPRCGNRGDGGGGEATNDLHRAGDCALARGPFGQLSRRSELLTSYRHRVPNEFSFCYGDLLTGSYDCVDRVVLNAHFSLAHNPGGFRVWWRRLHDDPTRTSTTRI